MIKSNWIRKSAVVGTLVVALVSGSTAAFASTPAPAAEILSQNSIVTPNSTKVPTQFWNLSNKDYNGAFTGVSDANGIYTNYYFSPSSSKTIKITASVTGDQSSSQTYTIELIDQSTGSVVKSDTKTADGKEYSQTYSNLNANKFYYFHWIAIGKNKQISGEATIKY